MSVFFPGAHGAASSGSRATQNTDDTSSVDTAYDTFIGGTSAPSNHRASPSLAEPMQRGVSPRAGARSPVPTEGLGAALIGFVLQDNDVALDKLLCQHTAPGALGKILNDTRHQGKTLMMLAAATGAVAVGRTLLRAGADPLVGCASAPQEGHETQGARSDGRLGSPMYLATVGGHAEFVRLLLDHGVRPEASLVALDEKICPGVVAALREKGVPPSAFKSLLDAWVTRPEGHQEAGILIEEGHAVPDMSTLIAAVSALSPYAVELVSKCGMNVNGVHETTQTDDNVYSFSARETKVRKQPLQVALEACRSDNAEAVEETVGALVRAGARASGNELSLAVKAENLALVRMCVAAKATVAGSNLLEVAYSGHVQLAAYFLDRFKFSAKELDEAAVRAQDNRYSVLANLFNAKKALLTATAEHDKVSRGRFQSAYQSLSGPATAARRQQAAVALESATERYERLISDARQHGRKDTANPDLPAPAAPSTNQSLVLFKR